MSHSFIDYPSYGANQGIVQDLTPAAAAGSAASALLGNDKRLSDRIARLQPIPPSFYGVYEPLFEGASGLANISGTFAVAPGGGLIASVSGTTASGVINLPAIPDSTKPWRFAALLQYGGDSHSCNVTVQNPSDTSWGTFSCSLSSTNGITIGVGGGFAGQLLTNLTVGQKFWFYAASDGNRVSVGSIPFGNSSAGIGYSYQGTVLQEFLYGVAANYSNNGHTPPFTGMGQINISTSSTANVVLGVFFNIGSLTGGWDIRMQPPAVVPVQITRADGVVDTTCTIFLPETYTGLVPTDIIHVGHPNASDESTGYRASDPDQGSSFVYLRNAGYITTIIRGDVSSYTNNYASPWGAPNGLAVRKLLFDWMRTNLPNLRHLYWIGQSMGCLDGLMYSATYPASIKALIGISGVANLSSAYSGSNGANGNNSTINASYPLYYVSVQSSNTGNAVTNLTWWRAVTGPGGVLQVPYATYTNRGAYATGTTYALNDVVMVNATVIGQLTDRDPTLRPGAFVNLPMKFWHGDSDTTIPIQQLQAFITAMAGVGVSVPLVTIAGSNHLQSAALWDGPGMAAFFSANK